MLALFSAGGWPLQASLDPRKRNQRLIQIGCEMRDTLARTVRGYVLLLVTIALAGCIHQQQKPTSMGAATFAGNLSQCCLNPEKYPAWLVDLVEPAAPLVGRTIAHVVWRQGYLANGMAQRAILSVLKPLDILVLSSKGRMSGHTIPGLFGHAAIYLGTETELRQMGAWDDPRIVPYQKRIRAGAMMIEADQDGIHLSPARFVLNADRVVVLRPHLTSNRRRREVITGFVEHIGQRFDFHFDNASSERLYCTELINHVMPEAGLPARRLYGRQSTLPDEVVARAAIGKSNLNLVLYVRSLSPQWESASRRMLVADIASAWHAKAE